ncbi:MAG: AAA family ATPase, partial [Deltaproteobacteria bacterium]|nr:AAA family ATPase [Deltaproteobacteria bacterium]
MTTLGRLNGGRWLNPMMLKNVDFFAVQLQNIRMWIARKYESTLLSLFEQFPAVVVTGPRQVGKTSLMRKVFPHLDYVSLDLPALAEQAEKSPELFFADRSSPLIIDEVQYAPSLPRFLKIKIDEHKKPSQFIL